MKKLVLFAAVGAFALSMASCKKCYDCTHEDAFFLDTEICSGDGVSKSDLDDQKAALELIGYECK